MKPFLKWAGNKYRLIDRIRQVLPPGRRLVEPFAGSAALFLNSDYPAYLLADANVDLINLFQLVQADGDAFIAECKRYFVPETNDEAVYYRLRDQFNAATDVRLRSALFLYMNRHGYNGLCRYNSQGKFNVPFGRYVRPYFPEEEMRGFCRKARRATFVHAGFDRIMATVQPGDVIYCDPPYVPLSPTAHFTNYSATRFGTAEQQLLAEWAEAAAARGVPVVISNHDTEFTQKVYRQADLTRFPVQRNISCKGSSRGAVRELLAVYR